MRSVEDHIRIVAGLLTPAPTVKLPLAEAAGRVLGAPLVAPISLPPFANSAMDGYAVRTADLTGFPIDLEVSQDIPAGRTDTQPLVPGTAARIMTGAPMPDGADTIVQVERTDGGTRTVRIDGAPPAGVHVRRVGEDVTAGTTALTAGTVVRAPQIGVAAAMGFATLPVRKPPVVLIVSTGTELRAPGSPLGPGQIYESNAHMLATAVTEAGGEARVSHFVADHVDEFRNALAAAADGVDLVLTSGGVSAGAYEVVKDALTGRGIEFAKVAMQPGMPQGAGTVRVGDRDVAMVTLPGNPVSSYVSFEVFVRQAIRGAIGHPERFRPVELLPLAAAIESPDGKRQFRRGQVEPNGTVSPWGGPGSHLLAWLAGADSMIVVPETITEMAKGDLVEVWRLA